MKIRYLAVGSVLFLVLFLRCKSKSEKIEEKTEKDTEVLDFGKVLELNKELKVEASPVGNPVVKSNEVSQPNGVSTIGSALTTNTDSKHLGKSIVVGSGLKSLSSPITTDKVVSVDEAILNKLDEMTNALKEVKQGQKVENSVGLVSSVVDGNEATIMSENTEPAYLGKIRQLKGVEFITTQTDAASQNYYDIVRSDLVRSIQFLNDNPTKENYDDLVSNIGPSVKSLGELLDRARTSNPELFTAFFEHYQYGLNLALILKEDIISLGILSEQDYAKMLEDLSYYRNVVSGLTHSTNTGEAVVESVVVPAEPVSASPEANASIDEVVDILKNEGEYGSFIRREGMLGNGENVALVPSGSIGDGRELSASSSERLEHNSNENTASVSREVLDAITELKAIEWIKPEGIGEVGDFCYEDLRKKLEERYSVFDGNFNQSDVLDLSRYILLEMERVDRELTLIRNRDLSIVYDSYRAYLERLSYILDSI